MERNGRNSLFPCLGIFLEEIKGWNGTIPFHSFTCFLPNLIGIEDSPSKKCEMFLVFYPPANERQIKEGDIYYI